MSHFRYVIIRDVNKEIYKGWFNLDLNVESDEDGRVIGFNGEFTKYLTHISILKSIPEEIYLKLQND